MFELHDEVVTAAGFCRIYNVIIACIRAAHTDIVHYGLVKEVVILRNIGDIAVILGKGYLSDINSAEGDTAAVNVPE